MNNNKENFKKAMDNINASEELKNKTFQKVTKKKKNNLVFMKVLSACAVFAIVFGVGAFYHANPNIIDIAKSGEEKKVNTENIDLPRFENIDELKKVLAKNTRSSYGIYDLKSIDADVAVQEFATNDASGAAQSENTTGEFSNNDYSKTNVQVDDVDEADIVKTDGNYIYYVKDNMVFILDAKNLEIVNKLDFDEDDNDFIPKEIFIKDDKLVVLGTSYIFEDEEVEDEEDADDYIDRYWYYDYNRKTVSEAVVMDISNKSKPKEERRITLDGYYNNSRMIDNNVYLISNKSVYYNKEMKDEDILPFYKDSLKSDDLISIPAEDIAYFGGTRNYSYMLVAGFNIENNEDASVETIFGASNTVYASNKNMYVVQEKYSSMGTVKSIIYKFNLDGVKIKLHAKGTVKGYLDSQFSMDEYDGNLRVATTSYIEGLTKNQLYILDDNLEKIGSINNMAINEKIYSVRFIGKIGYVVTFKQIDPLFVIDLSDPTNPEIKGELKIPGYSSYLHPYDENHIIGIGYNTKTNEYGGTVNENMKMSMFDVSDLENPQEMFSIDIGEDYASSEITSNHKALFYNKNMNLIGFPVRYNSKSYRDSKSGFTIFKIDLNKGFEVYGNILEKTDYYNAPKRVIYIKDVLYTLFEDNIESYDLNNLSKKDEVELK